MLRLKKMGYNMRKLEDLSISELVIVAEDEGLTEQQRGKIKLYTIGRIKEVLKTEQSKQTKETLSQILDDYRFSIGTDDMGYPYRSESHEQTSSIRKAHIDSAVSSHVDMYQDEA